MFAYRIVYFLKVATMPTFTSPTLDRRVSKSCCRRLPGSVKVGLDPVARVPIRSLLRSQVDVERTKVVLLEGLLVFVDAWETLIGLERRAVLVVTK
jgi:hypothetical protein